MRKWSAIKLYDQSMPMGIHVPPWPAYALPHGYPLGYGSIEHPMHTKFCGWEPKEGIKWGEKFHARYGKGLNGIYPWQVPYQTMHIERFRQPYRPVQAQCLGGKIDARSNKRAVIGCFHGKLVEGESCISRIVAFGGFDHVWHMARPYSRARYGM